MSAYDEPTARDQARLDASWLRDERLEDSASLSDPYVLAAEIADDRWACLGQTDDVLAGTGGQVQMTYDKRDSQGSRWHLH